MEISNDLLRGLMITLLAIISYLLISTYIEFQPLPLIIALGAGAVIAFLNKDVEPGDINIFRVVMFAGFALFIIGSVVVFQQNEIIAYSLDVIQALAFGLLITSVGLILLISQLPTLVYHNVKTLKKLKKSVKKQQV